MLRPFPRTPDAQVVTNAPESQPLTERPVPHGRAGRKAAELYVGQAERTAIDQALLDRLTGVEAVMRDLANLVRVPNRRVVWSGTVTISPNGFWSENFGHGTKAIYVVNNTGNGSATVSAAGPANGAPGPGVGNHISPAGTAMTFNGDTTVWTIYGTAGNVFDVQVFGVPMPPFAAGAI